MKSVLRHWKLNYNNVIEVKKNVWCIGDSYYLKAYNDKAFIRNLQLYEDLRNYGIPAPEIITNIQGENYTKLNGTYYFLACKMPGHHFLSEDVVNHPEKARIVGKTLGKLHKTFSIISDWYELTDNNFMAELNGWIKDAIEEHGKDSYAYRIYQECKTELGLVYNKLVKHMIHRDIHLGNLLFNANEITGYIDFDLTQINVRIFDLAYILAGWMVDKTHDESYMSNWNVAVQAIIKGYEEETKLSEVEISTIRIMICCIELLFIAYYFNINDIENASKAEKCLVWLWEIYDGNPNSI